MIDPYKYCGSIYCCRGKCRREIDKQKAEKAIERKIEKEEVERDEQPATTKA